jgi:amino acid transporter
VLLGLILPIFIGVANVYNVTGTWFTFALAFVYIVANVGLYLFYKREHADELNVIKHLVIPAIGTLALLVVVYYSVNPLPAWPVTLAPFIVLAWLVIGVIVVFAVYRGNRADDLRLAGVAMGEAVEHAIEERLVAPGQLPPPDAER